MPIIICLLVSVLLLTGCTTSHHYSESDVQIGGTGVLSLSQPPKALVGKRFMSSLIVKYTDAQHELIMQLEIDANKTTLVAVSPAGLPLFQQTYYADGRHDTEKFIPISDIDPRYILADIQLVHWPLAHLNQALMGAEIKEASMPSGRLREVVSGGKVMVSIQYNADKITFEHLQRQYQLTIKQIQE